MTQLHKMMLEELQRRNYSKNTARSYLSIVRDFAKHFNKPPDQLGLDEIRQYQAHLIEGRKLEACTFCYQTPGTPLLLRKDSPTAPPVGRVPFVHLA